MNHIIRKIYRKSVREVNRKLLLLKERRALRPLINTLPIRDIGKIEILSKDPSLRNQLEKAEVNVAALDQLIGLLASKATGQKILVRPHNFAGYLTHYHHFFGAVILPLLEWASVSVVSEGDLVVIRDCGPMNTELEQWARILGVHIVPVPQCLISPLAGCGMLEVWDAPGYDFSFREDWYPRKMVVNKIRDHVFGLVDPDDRLHEARCRSNPKIIIIARDKPDPFYKSRKADTKTCGAERRSIPNLDALFESLSGLSPDVEIVYLENMKVADKIRLFGEVDLVVGQMGAGLNNALWMKPESALIEILSLDSIRPNFAVFANICHRMDVRHRRVVQQSDHAAVNIPLIHGFAKDMLAHGKS
jgi:hypothetical protein